MSNRSPKQTFSLAAIFLVLLAALALVLLTSWNPWVIWLVAVNLITFLAYGYDKNQARSGGLRVPEIVLHGLALAGGFIGGWAGRAIFHHKTRKPIFAVVLAISTILWLMILYIVFLQ